MVMTTFFLYQPLSPRKIGQGQPSLNLTWIFMRSITNINMELLASVVVQLW